MYWPGHQNEMSGCKLRFHWLDSAILSTHKLKKPSLKDVVGTQRKRRTSIRIR